MCLYVLHLTGGEYILLLLYVDDILLAASNATVLNTYVQKIVASFRISSEGPLDSYLGITVKRDTETGKFHLSMARFMEKVFKRFKLVTKKSIVTPLPENFQASLEAAETEEEDPRDTIFFEDFQFRQKIGCILYYMICMRPNIMYAVSLLARYSNRLSRTACAGMTQLLQYCYNTRQEELVLGGTRAFITGYCDSDWAGDRLTRRSTGAYIIYLGSGPVEWASKLQKLPALSTAEAEYIAMTAPAKSIVWIRWLLFQTGIEAIRTKLSPTLFSDNTAAIAMSSNPVHHDRTKHIAIKYHFIRALEEAGVVSTEHIDTEANSADIGTKALGKRKFAPLSDKSMGRVVIDTPTKRSRTEPSSEFC